MDNYELIDGFLHVNGNRVLYNKSPNHGGSLKPSVFVFHDTAGPTTASAVNWFANSAAKASAHFVLGRAGDLTQCVSTDTQAWHAGKSSWKGRSGVNQFGIGLEIVNPGELKKIGDSKYKPWYKSEYEDDGSIHEGSLKYGGYSWKGYWMDYTYVQIEKCVDILRVCAEKYGIKRENVVTHWMISPGRKVDTNPLFPLKDIIDRAYGSESNEANDLSTVIANKLNFREWPSIEAPIVKILKMGDKVDVIRSGNFGNSNWYNIKAGDSSGWVVAEYILRGEKDD